mmetsp:Transcript_707/g.1601  ORF Transcript_707/g.1601 Transcript_707/m.1601 type:complete len:148 (-) Transcript_707:28-471(-)
MKNRCMFCLFFGVFKFDLSHSWVCTYVLPRTKGGSVLLRLPWDPSTSFFLLLFSFLSSFPSSLPLLFLLRICVSLSTVWIFIASMQSEQVKETNRTDRRARTRRCVAPTCRDVQCYLFICAVIASIPPCDKVSYQQSSFEKFEFFNC